MTASMRAYALAAFDQPARLVQMSVPEPGPREVRVRVVTSSVNPVDVACATGMFRRMYDYHFPAVLGRDLAGTVDRVGPEVTEFRPDDQVFGMVKRSYIGDGTFADYVIVPEDRYIVHRPPELGLTDAGAIGLAALTALQCVEALGCHAGDVVLVNGATGGVGAFAIQIAVDAGLHVIATARPGLEEQHVQELGAGTTVDWAAGCVPDAVRDLRPDGVDGVIDLIARDTTTFTTMSRAAKPDGIAVSTLGAAQETPGGPRAANIHSEGDPVLLQRVADLARKGTIRVPLVDVRPFEQIDDAFRLLASAPRGKVGLTLSQ